MDSKNIDEKKLAEFIGILLGDGSISLKGNCSGNTNRLKVTFNSRDDIEYIGYVRELVRKLFGIDPIIKHRRYENNTADLFIFKKEIILYIVNEAGLKLSPKWNTAIIPEKFLSNGLDLYVLRGCFDTDGCLVTTNNNGIIYPRLEMKVCPSPMQKQFIDIIKKHGFNVGVYQIGKGKVRIQLNGKEQLKKWIELVGFSNEKHIKKIERFL